MPTAFKRGGLTTNLTWAQIETRLRAAFKAWDVTEFEIPRLKDVQALGFCEVNFKLRGTWIPAKCDEWKEPGHKWEHKNFHAVMLAIEDVRLMDQRGIAGLLAEIASRVALPPGQQNGAAGAPSSPSSKPLRSPHEVLGVSPNADIEDIRHAARKKIIQLHSDQAKDKYDKDAYDEAMRAARYFGVVG